jgi:hypothetical protein
LDWKALYIALATASRVATLVRGSFRTARTRWVGFIPMHMEKNGPIRTTSQVDFSFSRRGEFETEVQEVGAS